MRARLWLLLWLLGILFPLAWLGRFSAAYRRTFNAIFEPAWMHVVMHAALFAGLAFLLVLAFQIPLNRNTAVTVIGTILLVGVFQEVLQSISTGQFMVLPALFDLCVDLTGGLAGLLAAGWADDLRKRYI
jgi:hypothetical protein